MASRSGSSARRQRSREPSDDFPALPVSRMPSLRALAGRERDPTMNSHPSRPLSRGWSTLGASRRVERAERIRNLEARVEARHAADTQAVGELTRALERSRWDPNALSAYRNTASLEELDRSLDETNAHIRMLFEMTGTPQIPPPPPPIITPSTSSFSSQRTHDYMDDHRRNKRRRLDSERRVAHHKPVRYGNYGQVQAGRLLMEIITCDGGMFSNESSYAAENILKNDSSVYCTKGNRCNIVLGHWGDTPFTLEELVIQGPTSANYSHPIREGMVFVAMEHDDVLKRTAQYQIQYASKQPPGSDENAQSSGNVREVLSIRHHSDGSTSSRSGRAYFRNDDDDDEYRIAQMPREFITTVPNVGVTTECSLEHDERGGENRRPPRRTPNLIGSLPFEDRESDEEGSYTANEFDIDGLLGNQPRGLSQEQLNGMTLSEAWEASASATQEAVRAVGGEMLAPHARFLIEKKNSKCSIRFDPPVTGRFILLKMWNSHHDPKSNIDIQTIITRGFSGPRYFPRVTLS